MTGDRTEGQMIMSDIFITDKHCLLTPCLQGTGPFSGTTSIVLQKSRRRFLVKGAARRRRRKIRSGEKTIN